MGEIGLAGRIVIGRPEAKAFGATFEATVASANTPAPESCPGGGSSCLPGAAPDLILWHFRVRYSGWP